MMNTLLAAGGPADVAAAFVLTLTLGTAVTVALGGSTLLAINYVLGKMDTP